jgi:hypothetical protein
MDDYDNETEFIDSLVEIGALEIISIDSNGEPVYKVTSICKDVFPELYKSHIEDVNQLAFELWLLDVVDIDFSEEGEKVSFRQHNHKKFLEKESTLTKEQVGLVNVLMDKNLRDMAQKYLD